MAHEVLDLNLPDQVQPALALKARRSEVGSHE